jgi:RNA polymerase sigma-70 factor (ECF subfamily)
MPNTTLESSAPVSDTARGTQGPTCQPTIESRDGALISRVLGGDNEAFYLLLKPYQRMLYASALSLLGNEADAEEVVQESVLKAYKNLARFRGDCKFSTWLVQITINEGRMRLRKYREHLYQSLDEPQTSEDGEYTPRDFADWREIPSEALERAQLRKALQDALGSLDQKYREVMVLRDVNGMSTREAANLLGITEASVKTRLLRARLMMRDLLVPGIGGLWESKQQPESDVRG